MRDRMVMFCLLLALAMAVGCADSDGDNGPSPTAMTATVEATATVRASATPMPTATATATPEPQAAVEVVAQSVDESGSLVASRVTTPQDGWLVVYSDDDGARGDVLGQAAVARGEQRDVALTVDPFLVTPLLHFVLHVDEGEAGAFEFPGEDMPLEVEGETVAATAQVDLLIAIPAIRVADQTLGENNTVRVELVSAAAPGWVAVYADEGGEPGQALGVTPVEAGETSDVAVRINWRQATRPLHAVLYVDGGEEGRFEPDEGDAAAAVSGEAVRAAFVVEGPPDIYVINQPVVTTEIVVERVYVNEPSWVVVFSNFEGFTDRLLGQARVEAGESLLVGVPVIPANTTDILHVQLHRDEGETGTFEYPAGDPPLMDSDGQPVRASLETDTGNYLVTRDQALGEDGTLVVPLVVSDLDTWVVVWTAAPDVNGVTGEGEAAGEILGQTLVERGVQRDVIVEIDAAAAGETLYVALHQDAGVLGEFEYPDVDVILRRGRDFIVAPVGIED